MFDEVSVNNKEKSKKSRRKY